MPKPEDFVNQTVNNYVKELNMGMATGSIISYAERKRIDPGESRSAKVEHVDRRPAAPRSDNPSAHPPALTQRNQPQPVPLTGDDLFAKARVKELTGHVAKSPFLWNQAGAASPHAISGGNKAGHIPSRAVDNQGSRAKNQSTMNR